VFSARFRYLSATWADIDAIFEMMSRHVIVSRRLRDAGVTGIPFRIGRNGPHFEEYRDLLSELGQLREERSGGDRRAEKRRRRSKKFFLQVKAALPDQLKHVPEADRESISDMAFSCPAAGPRTAHHLEEGVARLFDEAPALQELWTLMLKTQRTRLAEGRHFKMPPVLIVSPAGTGKSTASRRVAEVMGLHLGAIDAASSGTFALTGVEKGWGSAGPGVVTRSVLSGKTRNPLIVIDELEKGGGDVGTTGGLRVPGMHSSLLSLLEPSTAKRWRCPFYQVEFDLSEVSFIMTANGLNGIPAPLLSRLHVIKLGHLSADDLAHAARRQAREAGLPEDVQDSLDAAVRTLRRRRTLSMRDVSRIVEKLKGDDNEEFILH
jgi:hypothetical protein